jgi:hypothetical protein
VVGVRLGLKRIVEALEEDRGTSIGEVSHDAEEENTEEGVGFPAAIQYPDEAKHVEEDACPSSRRRRYDASQKMPVRLSSLQPIQSKPITGAGRERVRVGGVVEAVAPEEGEESAEANRRHGAAETNPQRSPSPPKLLVFYHLDCA